MKKWYRLIDGDNMRPDGLVADEDGLGDYEYEVKIGQPVEKWPEGTWVKVTESGRDGEPDDVLQTCLAVPVFSPGLRGALEAEGLLGIQFLPIRVLRPSGELSGFSVANVLNVVEGLDLVHSVYRRDPEECETTDLRGKVRGLHRETLIGSRIVGFDILRLSEFRPPIYVSERFVRVFEVGGFTGCSFSEVAVSDESDGLGARPAASATHIEGSRSSTADIDAFRDAFYARLFAAVEAAIGPLDPKALIPIIGLDVGGPVSLRTVGRGSSERFVSYLTCELAIRSDQVHSELGTYELLVTCDNEEWAREILTRVARMSTEVAFGPGHTVDICPWVGSEPETQGLAFEALCTFMVNDHSHAVYRLHGLSRKELEMAMERGTEAVLAQRKRERLYPRTEVR